MMRSGAITPMPHAPLFRHADCRFSPIGCRYYAAFAAATPPLSLPPLLIFAA